MNLIKKSNFSLIVLLLSLSVTTLAYCLPQDEQVVSGSATFDRSTSDTLNVNTPSDKLIVNYSSFDIALQETVNFNQPSSSAVALNRVTESVNPTQILGSLNANGRIFIINQNGVLFGSGSRVDAAALVASTLDIRNEDFLAGKYSFFKSGANAYIINKGNITVRNGGYICLLSQAIDNQGSIQAALGTIVLSSGEKMTLALDDMNDISVAIDGGVKEAVFGPDGKKIDSAVKNSGLISANGGKVILTAKVLNNVFDYAVNNTGVIEAKNVIEHDGVIELIAEGAPIINTGRIEAGEVKIEAKDSGFINKGDVISKSITGLKALNIDLFDTGSIISGFKITLNADTIKVTYSSGKSPFTMDPDSLVDVTTGAILQAPEVRVTAKKLGTLDSPLSINAKYTFIYRVDGDIDISDSLGIGTSVLLRGPPEGFGAIIYNRDTNLTLEANQVIISGTDPIHLYGNITFSNFTCTIPNKEIYFEAGKIYTILGDLVLTGGYGQLLKLRSSVEGQQWNIDPRGSRNLEFISIKDSYNINPEEIVAIRSNKEENCFNWDPTTTWTGSGADNNWSTGGNWDTGVTPPTGNDVLFDGVASNKDASVDAGFNGTNTINSLTINGSYAGTITLVVNLVISNGLTVSSGTLNISTFSPTAGVVTLSGGTINGTTGVLTGTSYSVNSGTISARLGGSGTLTKDTSSTVILSGANTYTGATTIHAGTLTFSGADGAATGSASFTVNYDGTLTLDNSSANNTNPTGRIGDTAGITLNGGDFNFIGNGSAAVSETVGVLTIGAGSNIVTVTPVGTGGSTTMTFDSFSRTAGATVLFRGTSLGSVPDMNVSTIMFTTTPSMTGASTTAGDKNLKIIPGAFGDSSLTGTGTDMLTYGISGSTGLRLLTAGEYVTDSFTTVNANVKLTLGTTATTVSINSLILNGGGVANPGSAKTLTIGSGNILLITSNDIAGGRTTLDFGPNEGIIRAIGNSIISSKITGSGGLTTAGTGTITVSNTNNSYTGTTTVTEGTFTLGAGGVLDNTSTLMVYGGTFSKVNYTQTLAGVTLKYGSIAGTTNALTVNSPNSFTVERGTISAILAGTGTLIKNTTGIVTLSGANTYSGGTNLNAGTLNINNAKALGATAGTFTIAAGTTIDNTSGSAITLTTNNPQVWNGDFTFTGTNSLNLDTGAVTLGNNRTVTVNANILTVGGVISGSYSLTKAGAGTLILSGDNTYTGTTTISAGTLQIGSGSTKGTLGVGAVTNNVSLVFNHSDALIVTNVISGTGSLTQAGSNTLTLSGNNTYIGDTIINDGTLEVGNTSAIPYGSGKGNVTVNASGTFDIAGYSVNVNGLSGSGSVNNSTGNGVLTVGNNNATSTFSGIIKDTSGTLTLTKIGIGTLTLSGANTYSGGTNLSAGTLNINSAKALGATAGTFTIAAGTTIDNTSGGSIALSYNSPQVWNDDFTFSGTNSLNLGAGLVTLGNNRTITVSANTLTVEGVISGSYSLTKAGIGTLILSGANTYTGATTINAGTLQIGDNTTAGTLGAGAVTSNASLVFNRSNALTVSNVISGTGTLTQSGSGTITLSGGNTYSGTTTINAGTLSIAADSGLGTAPVGTTANHLVFNGGTLKATATFSLNANRGITLNAGGGTIDVATSMTLTYDGIIAGSGALTKTSAGTLTLSGTNTYTGGTTLDAGTLNINNAQALGIVTGTFTITGGTIDNTSSGALTTISYPMAWNANFAFDGTNPLNLGTGGITLGNNRTVTVSTNTLTVGGVISGNYGLIKAGAGTLILSGANTYTGATTIDAGILSIGADSGLGIPPVDLTASQLILKGGTLQTTATFVLDSNRGIALNAGGGTIEVASGKTLTYGGIIAGSYALTKTGAGALILSGINTYSGTTTISGGVLGFTSVSDIPSGNLILNGGVLATNGIFSRGLGTGDNKVKFGANGGGFSAYGGALSISGLTDTPVWSSTTNFLPNGAPLIFGDSILSDNVVTWTNDFSLRNAARTITVNNNPSTTDDYAVISGAISSSGTSGSIIKNGAGTLALGGTNIYAGGTTVNAGTLNIQNVSALSTGAVIIDSGATLDLRNYSWTAGTLTNNGTVKLEGVAAQNVPNITTGTVEYTGDSETYIGLKAGYNYVTLKFSGEGIYKLGADLTVNSIIIGSDITFDPNGNKLIGTGTDPSAEIYGKILVDASTFDGNYTGFENNYPLKDGSTVDYKGTDQQIYFDQYFTYSNLTISGTGTYTLQTVTGVDLRVAGTLTNSAILDIGSYNLDLSAGALVNSGTIAMGSGTLILTDTTVNNTGILEIAGGTITDFPATIDGTVKYTVAREILAADYSTLSLTSSGDYTLNLKQAIATLNLTNANTTLTINNGIILTTSFLGLGMLETSDSGTNISLPSAANIIFTGNALNLPANTGTGYGTLTLQGNATAQGNITAASLSLANNKTLSMGANSLSVSGTFANNGTITVSTGDVSGILSGEVGNFTFTDTNTIPGRTYNILTINATDKTLTAGYNIIASEFKLLAGIFDTTNSDSPDSYSLDVTGDVTISGTFNANTSSITVGGDWSGSGGIFNAGTGTVTFDGEDNEQYIASGDSSFYNLDIANTYVDTVYLQNELDVDGSLTIESDSTLDADGYSINIAGDWTNNGGYFTPNENTVTFDGEDNEQYITSGDSSFYNLDIANASEYSVFLQDDLYIYNDLTIDTGSILDINGYYLEVDNNFYNDGTIRFIGDEAFPYFDSGMDTDSGLVEYYGDDSYDYDYLVAGYEYYDLSFTGGGTYILDDSLDINGSLTIESDSTLDADGYSINIAGDWTNNGGYFTPNENTVTFDGEDNEQYITSGDSSFYNLINSNGSPLTLILKDVLNIDGNLTIDSGSTLQAYYLDESDVEISSDINIAGNWSNSGTFAPGMSTVTFIGTFLSDITGYNEFYNLTINTTADGAKTVRFGAGNTQTITNTLVLTGAEGGVLTIRSTVDGTPATLIIPSPILSGVDYVDVQDNAIGDPNSITPNQDNCVDSGNNTNWIFNQDPKLPDSLGPAEVADGGWINDNTSTFNFNLSDDDAGQEVQFQIQIGTDSGFISLVVNYTSALGVQGAFSFTVGQAEGGGTYTTGSQGQTLADSALGYYWQVKNIDSDGASSAWKEAGVAGTVDFKVDTVAPTITGAATPVANANGWNNTNVTVSYTVNDALSGVDNTNPLTDYADDVLAGEDANQSTTGTVYDLAGNSASVTVTGINIDKTDPVITITSPANDTTYDTVQKLLYTTADNLDADPDMTGPASGTNYNIAVTHNVLLTATDLAGNSTSKSLSFTIVVPAFTESQLSNVTAYRVILPSLGQLNIYQVNTITGAVYFYHPLTEMDMAAFDELIIEDGAYQFMKDGSIGIVGHDGLLQLL